ncbi:HIT family protein [Methanobacterium sp.]|uniref:HIT family protein n=1 Tax=Methanobacterium sp. TaxID=2164 RepID=UPI002AB971C2|nr:HIT family protein [Methanobacterium sp.]MDY9924159.1 HIT family protein [Methanobacterium sp.]
MECEYFEKLKDHKFGDLLAETEHWLIILAPDQRNLGTCVVALKRDETELSGLNDEEWADLSNVVKKLESAVKKAFDATMFNWGCLMNSSYLEDPPCPHLHWHFIPRYQNPVKFNGETFYDPCFGKSTMHCRDPAISLPTEFKNRIKTRIMENLKF